MIQNGTPVNGMGGLPRMYSQRKGPTKKISRYNYFTAY